MSDAHALTIYVPDPIWQTLQRHARQHGATVAEVVVDQLQRTVPTAPKPRATRARRVPAFATRLAQERTKRQWSINGFARLAQVDPTLISRYESGQRAPSFPTVGLLATVLRLSPQETESFYRAAGFAWSGADVA